MNDALPIVKNKKRINLNKFIKRARELKEYYDEELAYLRKKEIENENLLSRKSF